MGVHKTVVCECGKTLSTCRCRGPKSVVVSPKPCTHKDITDINGSALSAAAITATASNHPAASQTMDDFYRKRFGALASILGLRTDVRMLTDSEFQNAIISAIRVNSNRETRKAINDLLTSLEEQPANATPAHFGASLHFAEGRDRERQVIAQRLRDYVLGNSGVL